MTSQNSPACSAAVGYSSWAVERARSTGRDEESRTYAVKRAAQYNEAGVTPRTSWTLFAARRIGDARFGAAVAALRIALAGGHWLMSTLLLLTRIPASRLRDTWPPTTSSTAWRTPSESHSAYR
jgi:hypothetical protein